MPFVSFLNFSPASEGTLWMLFSSRLIHVWRCRGLLLHVSHTNQSAAVPHPVKPTLKVHPVRRLDSAAVILQAVLVFCFSLRAAATESDWITENRFSFFTETAAGSGRHMEPLARTHEGFSLQLIRTLVSGACCLLLFLMFCSLSQ